MPGELAKDCVIIGDPTEASQIYNKGYYGYPMSGGGLQLELLEALYLVEASRLEVLSGEKPVPLHKLMGPGRLGQPGFRDQVHRVPRPAIARLRRQDGRGGL